ncbi:hypothetical protein ACFVZW_17695 [Streptomyces sp. NPDC059567]|uniref:hypothetical protein n=1 Tax=Streptomyces sp. NPDC059567 TaxID=3346867 RepID=UPI0036AAAE4B
MSLTDPAPSGRRTWHRPLTVCAILLAALTVLCGVGVALDDRTLLGESVWVKPLKFGFAFALYSGTLAWLLTKLNRGRRLAWWVGTVFAVATVAEVGAITVQAARGTFSHFNADQTDPITLALVPILTFGVLVIVIAQLIIGVVVLRQRTGGRDLNRAIRAGLWLATAGMIIPIYWMVTGVHPRTVTDANGDGIKMYQGHGIGDPDGHGMALTNWSVTGGDFRVPHFFALHGIQVLLVLTAVLIALSARHAWLRDERVRSLLVGSAALGYWGLVAVVTWQAARGQSLVHPDAATLVTCAAVLLLTAVVTVRIVVTARRAAASREPAAYDHASG